MGDKMSTLERCRVERWRYVKVLFDGSVFFIRRDGTQGYVRFVEHRYPRESVLSWLLRKLR